MSFLHEYNAASLEYNDPLVSGLSIKMGIVEGGRTDSAAVESAPPLNASHIFPIMRIIGLDGLVNWTYFDFHFLACVSKSLTNWKRKTQRFVEPRSYDKKGT